MMMAPDDHTISLSTGDFQVAPGSELTQCMYLPLPSDSDVAVYRFEAHMRPGSHHFNFYYIPPGVATPTQGLGDCNEKLRIFLAGSQWQDLDETLPNGMAIKIPRNSWVVLESHFVNATNMEGTGGVDVTLHTIDPQNVVNWVGVYFNVMNGIHVPAASSAVLAGRCPAYSDTNVFLLTSHMHHFGQQFDINLFDGNGVTPLYTSTDWEHPKILDLSSQQIAIAAGQGFEWKCHYYNDRAVDLYGGDSAVNNEMCIMAAFYWPAAPGLPYCFADATVSQ